MNLSLPKIEGFEVQSFLGRGATAQVFRAKRLADGLTVALKVFHQEFWDSEDLRRRIQRESVAVLQLDHANILKILDVRLDQTPPYLVMECVNGESLEALQARLPYILPEVSVLLILQVLEALEVAHAQGVVHRDLKPANILFDGNGKIKVVDFGLAKISDLTQATLTGTVLGSPDFMAPEQACGDLVTERSDLFSLSSIFYFLVTGTRPFSRQNALATLAAVHQVDFEPAQKRNPKVSVRLASLIHRGFAKNSQARYASASEFKNDLKQYLQSIGLSEDSFNLAAWLKDPRAFVTQSLIAISESLMRSCESFIKEKKFDEAIEVLSHLGQVAPESGAIPRLLEEIEAARAQTTGKKRFFYWAVPALSMSLVAAIASFTYLKPRALKPNQSQELLRAAQKLATATEAVAPNVAVQRKALSAIAKPAAVTNSGSVQFDIPHGVQAYWDGRKIDATKGLKNVASGEHHLTLVSPGADPIVSSVHVKANEPTVIRVGE